MAREREYEIICPHCGKPWRNEEHEFITYHGEGDDHEGEVECGHCEEKFWVEEHVSRTWSTYSLEDLAKGKR